MPWLNIRFGEVYCDVTEEFEGFDGAFDRLIF
jgi:hypothetical protein